MRTIKFRAWDKDKKCFIPTEKWAVVSTDFNAFGIMLEDWENYKQGEYFYSNSQELMQFTGLHDKNGREIYENDIVKWGHTEGYGSEMWHRAAVVEMYPALQFRILHYIDTQTMERKEGDNYVFKFGRFMYAQTDKYLEVIGNVHENPDLL